jgi:hypothetical protein
MSISTFERNASIAEMAVEMDRRGLVIERLEDTVHRLRTVLEFYATRTTYVSRIGMESPITNDNFGDRARAELSASRTLAGGEHE